MVYAILVLALNFNSFSNLKSYERLNEHWDHFMFLSFFLSFLSLSVLGVFVCLAMTL